jgi:CRP/FNR family cyclic AMP-dependent transcriptional regulator
MHESRLKSVALFEELSARERSRIARVADEVEIPEGKDLVREGEFSYEFFLIEEGSVEVLRRDGGPVAALGPGDFFGEIGAIDDLRRNATVVTTSPLTAIVMTAHDLRAIAREMPALANRLRSAVQERTQALVP